MAVRIIIGADIVPTEINSTLFEAGDAVELFGRELIDRIGEADFFALNLETPLTDTKDPIKKCGPALIASTKTVNGLCALNPNFITLANNHIMDQGAQGLISTIETLSAHNIMYSGIGNNLQEASKPLITQIKDITIGIYCCTEHEFSVAGKNCPGANPYDPLNSFDCVKELADVCDYVIVLYHGGKEHYQYPSPQLRTVFHKFAEKGANLVIAQHTHCIGCKEKYKEAMLIYGQGNFLFDHLNNELWKTGLLIELTIKENTKQAEFVFVPLVHHDGHVRMADQNSSKEILEGFEQRSLKILEDGFVEKEYQKLAKREYETYLNRISGLLGRILRFGYLKKTIGKQLLHKNYNRKIYTSSIINAIECESHRELFLEGLKDYNN